MLGADYRKPKGTRFGLDGAQWWSMKVLVFVDEVMEDEGSNVNDLMLGSRVVQEGRQIRDSLNGAYVLPNLNDVEESEELPVESMAIIPFYPQKFQQDTCGAMVFGVDLNVAPSSHA